MDSEVSFFVTFESKEEAGGNVYFLSIEKRLIKSGIAYQRISLIRAGALTMALFTYV